MKIRKWLTAISGILALGIFLGVSVPAMAQEQQMPKTEPAGATNIVDFIKLHPMSPEAEAAIVHKVPPVETIIIDGVKYKAEDIALFNGHRLGFITDKNGQRYAFTDPADLKEFADAQREVSRSIVEPESLLSIPGARLYRDWLYGGDGMYLFVNEGTPDLGTLNNQSSSIRVYDLYDAYLFDYTNYGGNFDKIEENLPLLGYNDWAESGVCFWE